MCKYTYYLIPSKFYRWKHVFILVILLILVVFLSSNFHCILLLISFSIILLNLLFSFTNPSWVAQKHPEDRLFISKLILKFKHGTTIWRLWTVNGRKKIEGRKQNSEFHQIRGEFTPFRLPGLPGLNSKEAWNPKHIPSENKEISREAFPLLFPESKEQEKELVRVGRAEEIPRTFPLLCFPGHQTTPCHQQKQQHGAAGRVPETLRKWTLLANQRSWASKNWEQIPITPPLDGLHIILERQNVCQWTWS